jgi:hypothetical protein
VTDREPQGKITHIVNLRPDELDALNNGVSIQQRVGAYEIVVKPPKPLTEMDENASISP